MGVRDIVYYSIGKIFDEAAFYCIRYFFAPMRPVFYSFMTFLSDAGGHRDR